MMIIVVVVVAIKAIVVVVLLVVVVVVVFQPTDLISRFSGPRNERAANRSASASSLLISSSFSSTVKRYGWSLIIINFSRHSLVSSHCNTPSDFHRGDLRISYWRRRRREGERGLG